MHGAPPADREIESIEQLDRVLASGHTLAGRTLQSLDLVGRAPVLVASGVKGTFFLGCRLADTDVERLRTHGALVFPPLDDVPFNPYQPRLYTADDLYGQIRVTDYEHTFDARCYAWNQRVETGDLRASLATSLHDHAISDALDEWVEAPHHSDPRHTIGVMGGHAAARGTGAYEDAAQLASQLTAAGCTIMTGGGPGAMEAANLGARLAGQDDALAEALRVLAAAASFSPVSEGGSGVTAWARAAFDVIDRWPASGTSLGIPTWFYGHEPPNPFATAIAKYFSNALREDILLQRCKAGIIYLPGAAGTVQEIFQGATANYYAADPSRVVPMVLVGRDHWTSRLPAWSLLEALGRDRAMGAVIHVVDGIDDAFTLLTRDLP